MSSDGRRRESFTDRLRTASEDAIEAHETGGNQYLDGLDLWSLLGPAADLIEAQKKELDAYAYVAPVTVSTGEGKPQTSQRIVRENGFVFVDYDGEGLDVEARDGRSDVYICVKKFGEGPVMMDFDEFRLFCLDGLDLLEKIEGEKE